MTPCPEFCAISPSRIAVLPWTISIHAPASGAANAENLFLDRYLTDKSVPYML